MISKFISWIFWVLVLTISVSIIVVMFAVVMVWLVGIREPLTVGAIIGTNTLRNHASGIFTGIFIIVTMGSALGFFPSAASKDKQK